MTFAENCIYLRSLLINIKSKNGIFISFHFSCAIITYPPALQRIFLVCQQPIDYEVRACSGAGDAQRWITARRRTDGSEERRSTEISCVPPRNGTNINTRCREFTMPWKSNICRCRACATFGDARPNVPTITWQSPFDYSSVCVAIVRVRIDRAIKVGLVNPLVLRQIRWIRHTTSISDTPPVNVTHPMRISSPRVLWRERYASFICAGALKCGGFEPSERRVKR